MIRVLLIVLLFSVAGSIKAQVRASANVSESSCNGNFHTVSIKASGGEAPYTFIWSDGGTTAFRNDLKGGRYTCMVTDGLGKSYTYAVSLKNIPAALTVIVTETVENGQRTLKAEASGGDAPYTYMWVGKGMNPKDNNTSVQSGVASGEYTVIVQDNSGCPVTQSITLN